MHLGVGHAAVLLQPGKQRRHCPGVLFQDSGQVWLQHPRNIFDQATTGDVHHPLDLHRSHECQQRLDIDAGRRHQHVGQRLAVEISLQVGLGDIDDLAYQRVAVRMRARRGQAKHHVANCDRGAVDDLRFFHSAHSKAGQVILAIRIHRRHLGRLATDQSTTSLLAALRNALDDGGRRRHIEFAAGEIIEEKQWLGTLHQDVVDAHGDQVDADGVVPVQMEGQTQLGADTIGAGDQDRLLEFLADFEQRAKTTEAAHDALAHGALGKWLDRLDQRIAGIDVDTGIAVREGHARGHVRRGTHSGIGNGGSKIAG